MATVVADMSMSLDGFVADPSHGIDQLFGWFFSGDVEVPTADPRWKFMTSEASAAHLREQLANVGALVTGRRNFDLAQGWGGNHPVGVPVFIVTHEPPAGWDEAPFTFVTDGVESAVKQASEVAGDKMVAVATPSITQQCLNAGLLDGISVNVVPVLLGDGVRFFERLENAPVQLEDPRVIEGTHVTHLFYRVTRD
jgi:dihydrofolate reductase